MTYLTKQITNDKIDRSLKKKMQCKHLHSKCKIQETKLYLEPN
jgi:hypothetical protein